MLVVSNINIMLHIIQYKTYIHKCLVYTDLGVLMDFYFSFQNSQKLHLHLMLPQQNNRNTV